MAKKTRSVEYYRLWSGIRVARTIANMEESANIQEPHLAEAVQYRLFDRRQ